MFYCTEWNSCSIYANIVMERKAATFCTMRLDRRGGLSQRHSWSVTNAFIRTQYLKELL
jgi:hypothetical protein